MNLKSIVNRHIVDALEKLNLTVESFDLSSPKNPKFGDLSTNAALILAKQVGKNPMEIAKDIEKTIVIDSTIIHEINVTPPGFINFKISPSYYQLVVQKIINKNNHFYSGNIGKGKTANVEFVSANPTGPLSVGHGRQAVIGDTVASILQWHGYDVTREYYYNDAGKQIRSLGKSVWIRNVQFYTPKISFPEDGYRGDYIKDVAKKINRKIGQDQSSKYDDPIITGTLGHEAAEIIFEDIKIVLKKLDIEFDKFFNERSLYQRKILEDLLNRLNIKGLTYEKDDALWLKMSELGRETDKVIWKSINEPTYRLPDIAYHEDKIKRGYDLIVDVFGSDHIDTYPDVLITLKALGYDIEHLKVLIHQFVTLTKGGKKVKMSTRKAEYVTLDELIKLVGKDVVRYFFIMRGMSTHLNFDLELAQDQSEKNPVFYLQYAHARICNIIRHGEQQGVTFNKNYDSSLLSHNVEIELMKQLNQFPEIMATVLESLEPRSIANYLQSLAASFHKFYTECHVITDDIPLSQTRIALISATRNILAEGLHILGINAPERM
jgi:arginyl-tRNA synthetase